MSEINLILIVDDGYGYLVKEKFDIVHCKYGAAVVHVLLQVSLKILKHQREWLVCVNDIMESHWNINKY